MRILSFVRVCNSVAHSSLRKSIEYVHNGIGNAAVAHRWAVLGVYLALSNPWMVSIGKGRAVDYYLNEVSVEDAIRYYGQDARGHVSGRLAADNGISGPIDRAGAEALAELRWPTTGEQITERKLRRLFFDLTMSPPKSVSIFWAASEGAERTRIEAILGEAIQAALDTFEREAAKGRRGTNGINMVDGNGLAFMTFIHTTSRAEDTDPQYHAHNLVLNAVEGPDGRTTALDSRTLYKTSYAADAVFQATLREGLRREFGLLFTEVDRHGAAEIVGIGKEVREAFSARRLEILADMADRGTSSADAARLSALTTRLPKSDPSEAQLRQRWAERFAELGYDNRDLPSLDRANAYSVGPEAIAEYVTQRSGVYERRHVIVAAGHLAIEGATPEQMRSAVESYFDSPFAIELNPGVYTTPEILELESNAALIALDGRHVGGPSVEPETLARSLELAPELDADQRRAVEVLTTSSSRVDVLIGPPGTGKGYVMGIAAQAFETEKFECLGTTLAAVTAKRLESSTGIPSRTTAALFRDLDSGRLSLTSRSVLFVDEAGMVGTRQAARIIDEVEAAGAKVILVGDAKQLPEIEAGGLFAAIQHRVGGVELHENHRLQNTDELAAARALRDGDPDSALANIHRAGSLTMSSSRRELVETLARDWYETYSAGESSVMLAPTRADTRELNTEARQLLHADGKLGRDLVAIDDVTFAEGDRVVGRRNDYRLGILNGSQGIVVGLDERNGLQIELDDGKQVTASAQYLEDRNLAHGYAITGHGSQGATYDSAYLLGSDAVFQELGYVGLTRARQSNRFYTVVSRDEFGQEKDDRLSDVRSALRQSRAQRAAIDHQFPERDLT